MIKKLFQLSGDDWMKGNSVYSSKATKGLFQTALNFNPFRTPGTFRTIPSNTQIGSGTIDTTIRQLVGFNDAGVPKFYGFGNTKLYEINALTFAVSDESAEVTLQTTSVGAIKFKERIVYANNGTTDEIRSNVIPVASASDVQILTTNVEETEHPFVIGADLNLYFPNGQYIGKITSVTGTTGNDARVFDMGAGVRIRQLINDGRYLVIIADENASETLGTFRSIVAYWDYTSGTLSQRWDFDDSFLVGAGIIGKDIYVFGKNNMYITNLATPPTVFVPLRSPALTEYFTPPVNAHSIISTEGQMFWGSSTGAVHAYGNPTGDKKIFYRPTEAISGTLTTITLDWKNKTFWTASDTPRLDHHNNDATRTTATIRTVNFNKLDRAYKLSHYKVYLRSGLASGDSVTLTIRRSNGGVAPMATATFSFANSGAKYTGIIRPTATANTLNQFEDFDLEITSNGPVVHKVELWAEPLDEQDQSI